MRLSTSPAPGRLPPSSAGMAVPACPPREALSRVAALAGRVPVTAITGADGSPVTTVAPETIVMDFADERSFVQTRFATSVLALLRAHLGEAIDPIAADAGVAVRVALPVA